MHIERGIDDRGVAAVAVLDALSDEARDGDELGDALGGGLVPGAQAVDQRGQHGAGGAAELLAAYIALVVPQKTRRGQAIADVRCALAGVDAVGKGAGVGDHQVKAVEVQALKGQGIERQEELVLAA